MKRILTFAIALMIASSSFSQSLITRNNDSSFNVRIFTVTYDQDLLAFEREAARHDVHLNLAKPQAGADIVVNLSNKEMKSMISLFKHKRGNLTLSDGTKIVMKTSILYGGMLCIKIGERATAWYKSEVEDIISQFESAIK